MEKGKTDLFTYLEVIWRRKWLALAILAVSIASTLFHTLRVVPVYRATTTLIVDTSAEAALLEPRLFWFLEPSEITKHGEILKSRSMAKVVAQNLPQDLLERLPRKDEEGLASWLRHSISIDTDKNAQIIRISVQAGDPEIAARLANLAAESYQSYNLTQSRAAVTAMREFIEEQLRLSEERLNRTEHDLQKFKESEAILSLDQEITNRIEGQVQFQTAYQQVKIERQTTEKRLSYLKEQIERERSGLVAQLEASSSPLLENLRSNLTHLELARANLILQGFSEENPKIKVLDSQMVQAKENLRREADLFIPSEDGGGLARLKSLSESVFSLRIDLEGQKAREMALKETLKGYEQKLKTLPAKERAMARLVLNSEVNEKIYLMLSEKKEEARIREAGRVATIRIIDEALPPSSPIKPKKKRDLAIGVLVGLLLSVGLSFLLEYVDTSVKSPDDLERVAKLSPLAAIPNLNSRGFLPLIRASRKGLGQYLLTNMPLKSRAADAFRILRTNLQYVSVDHPVSSLLVTSPGLEEGKSLIATNLSIALAQMGSKTVLVDADLRRPVIHKVFGIDREPGLTELIVGGKGVTTAMHSTSVENLYCLSAGSVPPNTADILNSKAAERVYDELNREFDFIIYDTAPVLLVADTPILATKVRDVILVAKAKTTSRMALEDALKTLSGLKVRLLGVVLNGLERGVRYGRYYHHYYHHQD